MNTEPVLLGAVQGLTEFLPVSSSGHLVFFQDLLGWKEPEILFDVTLHVGTLLAIIIFFWKDIIQLRKDIRTLGLIVLASIPTAIIGLFIKKYMEAVFCDSTFSAGMLLVTGGILYYAQKYSRETKNIKNFSYLEAILVGTIQGMAVLPGISRSGATICTGMLLGWNRTDAFKFSFLLSIPSILGATVLELRTVNNYNFPLINYIIGIIVSLLFGIFALYLLARFVKQAKLHWFAYYCWFVGILVLVTSYFLP